MQHTLLCIAQNDRGGVGVWCGEGLERCLTSTHTITLESRLQASVGKGEHLGAAI